MSHEILKLAFGRSQQGNEGNLPSYRQRFRPRPAWGVAALAACLCLLGVKPVASITVEGQLAVSPHSGDFVIAKAEGRDGDELRVTYTKGDCFLSGVNSAVSFHYKSGAEVTVTQFWSQWQSGETKVFRNVEFRQGPIQKAAFWGTGKETFLRNGKKAVARVTFSQRMDFTEAASP